MMLDTLAASLPSVMTTASFSLIKIVSLFPAIPIDVTQPEVRVAWFSACPERVNALIARCN